MADTLEEIKSFAAKQFAVEPDTVDVNAPVDKLGLDSLGFLEFMFELEDHLKLSIPQDALTNVRTLADLAAVIDRIKSESTTAPTS
jgi:acyl carrier protein